MSVSESERSKRDTLERSKRDTLEWSKRDTLKGFIVRDPVVCLKEILRIVQLH